MRERFYMLLSDNKSDHMQKKKKKNFTSFCQPTRPITCANYGNHVQIFIKSRQSMT